MPAHRGEREEETGKLRVGNVRVGIVRGRQLTWKGENIHNNKRKK